MRTGNGRKTPGGGEKVTHKGWPSVTGMLWKVIDDRGHRKLGGPDNDELLGHHGSDRISGRGGKDIIWGDWDPRNNNTWQRDVMRGGDGNDWIYASHGSNTILGGRGRDYIWAYYGRGTIDCGPAFRTPRASGSSTATGSGTASASRTSAATAPSREAAATSRVRSRRGRIAALTELVA